MKYISIGAAPTEPLLTDRHSNARIVEH